MPESEVLIIGGGIAGASTALYLARRGRDVALVERGEIASEASGVNAGQIGAIGWGDMPDLAAYLTMGSLRLFEELQLDLGYDIEFRQSGSLTAIHTPDQYGYIRDHVHSMRARGFDLALLTPREARAIEPEINPNLPGYMHTPLRAQADPVKGTRAFAAAARSSGARIFANHEVGGVAPLADGGYSVATGRGEFRCGALVVAAGAWSARIGEMLGLRIPIVPVRGQMWATPSLPPMVFQTISSAESSHDWSMGDRGDARTPPELTHRGDARVTRHLYGRQRRNGEIIFGGDRQLVGFDKSVDHTGIEVNRGHASEVIPLLNGIPAARTWAGLMPFTLDGQPLIGRVPTRDNLYIVGGLASSGFGRGPMAGKLLADYIHTGHMPHMLFESDPGGRVTDL